MASGNTLCVFTPRAVEPPAAAMATLDTRNAHPVLDFDAAADESAIFTGVLPRHYASGGITVHIHFAMSTAVAGKVRWESAFERIGDELLDIDADSFATPAAVNVAAVPSAAGTVEVTAIFHTNAQIDGLLIGEAFRLKITRKGTDATNDTAAGDAELLAVELKET